MITSIIVAVSENNVIGKDNGLIWHLPDDLNYFKEKTLGHHILMGRKNYLSIPEKYRPLAKRINLILTRNKNFKAPGCITVNDIEDAKRQVEHTDEDEFFIIGGGEIYNLALQKNMVDRLYITKIHHTFEGDTFFPEIDNKKWKKVSESYHDKNAKHQYAFSFCVFEKIS